MWKAEVSSKVNFYEFKGNPGITNSEPNGLRGNEVIPDVKVLCLCGCLNIKH
jgi:hypothetical protein